MRILIYTYLLFFLFQCRTTQIIESKPDKCASEIDWNQFRQRYTDNYQGISVYPQKENNYTIIVSEPPPTLKPEDFREFGSEFDSSDSFFYCDSLVGEDGRKRDVIFKISGKEKARKLVSTISQKMYGKYISVSKSKIAPPLKHIQDKISYNLEINSMQLLNLVHFAFKEHIGTSEKPNYDYFYSDEPKVIEPDLKEKEGIIVFSLSKKNPIKDTSEFKDIFRLFSLKSDLIIGALATDKSLLLIGRKRQISPEIYPPMRYETFLRLAQVAEKEKFIDDKLEEYTRYLQYKNSEYKKAKDIWCNLEEEKRKAGTFTYEFNGKQISLHITFEQMSVPPLGFKFIEKASCIYIIGENKGKIDTYFWIYEKDDNSINSNYYSDLQMKGGLLNQSFERQRTIEISSLGKINGMPYSDITPNYLTDYTNDTEIGQVLTIADMHLKGGSEEGKVIYHNYRPFLKIKNESVFEAFEKLNFKQVIYNWNGREKFRKSKIKKLSLYSINSTGAMNASFITLDGLIEDKEIINKLEKEYNERFKNSGSYSLANVVKYNFLKDILKDNNISIKSGSENIKFSLDELKNTCTKIKEDIISGRLSEENIDKPNEMSMRFLNLNRMSEDTKKSISKRIRILSSYEEILSKGKKNNTSWIVTPTIIRSQNSLGGIGGHNNDVPLEVKDYRDIRGLSAGSGRDDADNSVNNSQKNKELLQLNNFQSNDSEIKNTLDMENEKTQDKELDNISNVFEKSDKLKI